MSTLTEMITEALDCRHWCNSNYAFGCDCADSKQQEAATLAAVVAEWLGTDEVVEAVRRPHETVPLEEMRPAVRRISTEMRALIRQDLSAVATEAVKGADA